MARKILPALLVLALASYACSASFNLPVSQTVGPTMTDQISLALPANTAQSVDLSLAFGAGTLKLHPGSEVLLSGTATYNVPEFKPVTTVSGSRVRLEQGNWHLNGIPDLSNIKNEWDLSLGTVPLNLMIEGGAYNGTFQFGGLALTNLTVKDGAAQSTLDFSAPNAAQMSLLSYETGASNVSLTGLGNANFASLEFRSGAGNYSLDFSGGLKRDGSVHISTGVSNLTLVIPTGIPTQITVEGGLSNVAHDSGWAQADNVYTQSGSGPQLTIVVEIGAGNLTLTR